MDEGDAALGGPSGGAVGGTPAGKRSSGGHRHLGQGLRSDEVVGDQRERHGRRVSTMRVAGCKGF